MKSYYNITVSIIYYLRVGFLVFFSFFNRMNWGPLVTLYSLVLMHIGLTVSDGSAVG